MEIKRKPFQGVWNIIRFNWHFYVMEIAVFMALLFIKNFFSNDIQLLIKTGIALSIFTLIISLLASYYIYDVSDLYQLRWIKNLNDKKVLNINAGFDETSAFIQQKFPKAECTICDFYDAEKHTEISIKRARKAYPPHPKTISVTTENLPFDNTYFDEIFAILSAHEIRNQAERIHFFKELNRTLKPDGKIFVTEHLRDVRNFLVYTIGFFHFHSKKTWIKTFINTGFNIKSETKTTPFITTFELEKSWKSTTK